MSPPRLLVDAAGMDDLDALLALEQLCYSHPWTARNFETELASPERGRVVALRDPLLLQAAERGIQAYCSFQVVVDELHILNLTVAPALRRRGIGRWLLDLAQDLGRRRGARQAFLEVRSGNQAALGLYRSAGFEYLNTRPAYYSRPREDAIVLHKTDP